MLGEAPGETEDLSGRPFVGKAGRLLRDTLQANGIDPSSVYITNSVKCRPPANRKPTSGELATCNVWLTLELEAVQPDVILLLGQTAIDVLLTRRVYTAGRKTPKITRLYGKMGVEDARQRDDLTYWSSWWRGSRPNDGNHAGELLQDDGPLDSRGSGTSGGTGGGAAVGIRPEGLQVTSKVICAYHPAAALRSPRFMSGFVRDIERLAETLGVKQQADEQHAYRWVHSMEGLDELLACRLNDPQAYTEGLRPLALDTEFDKDGLHCYSVSWKESEGWCVFFSGDSSYKDWARRTLRELVDNSSQVVFHNAKADIPVLQAAGVRVPWEKVQDTIVQAYVLRKAPLGLKDLASNELGLKVIRLEELRDPDVRLADMDQARLAHYSAQDADLTLRLYHKFRKELSEA